MAFLLAFYIDSQFQSVSWPAYEQWKNSGFVVAYYQ